jgi:hypothetical protein
MEPRSPLQSSQKPATELKAQRVSSHTMITVSHESDAPVINVTKKFLWSASGRFSSTLPLFLTNIIYFHREQDIESPSAGYSDGILGCKLYSEGLIILH